MWKCKCKWNENSIRRTNGDNFLSTLRAFSCFSDFWRSTLSLSLPLFCPCNTRKFITFSILIISIDACKLGWYGRNRVHRCCCCCSSQSSLSVREDVGERERGWINLAVTSMIGKKEIHSVCECQIFVVVDFSSLFSRFLDVDVRNSCECEWITSNIAHHLFARRSLGRWPMSFFDCLCARSFELYFIHLQFSIRDRNRFEGLPTSQAVLRSFTVCARNSRRLQWCEQLERHHH